MVAGKSEKHNQAVALTISDRFQKIHLKCINDLGIFKQLLAIQGLSRGFAQ